MVDIETLRQSIGNQATASDLVTAQKCDELLVTLDKVPLALDDGQEAPQLVHWCLAQPTVPLSGLGTDGHPAKGGFLPAVPLPRRMWAAGQLTFVAPILVGDRITRRSRIEDVTLKEGRTGALCFVTVRHEISTPRGLAIEERQDIVYRSADTAPAAAPAKPPQVRPADHSRQVMADTTLLFRYSALTFNAHRIHYDRPYATGAEGYPGLVVHGPLQATFLLTLARELRGPLRSFGFRGVSPLFDGAAFSVNAAATEAGLDLWTADATGRTTMTAEATW